MPSKYLSIAIALNVLDRAKAIAVIRAKLAGAVGKMGVVARDLKFITEDQRLEVEDFKTILDARGVELPDLLGLPLKTTAEHELFETKLPEFLLQEYWQLRQEIRDRLNSIRTIMGVTVTSYTAVIAGTATILASKSPPPFFTLSLLWLAPQAIVLPAMRVIYAERLSVLRLATHIRLHCELPFFEAGLRLFPTRTDGSTFMRMPVGWESTLVLCRWAAEDIGDLDRAEKAVERSKSRNPFRQDKAPKRVREDEDLVYPREVYSDVKHRGGIESHRKADRLESTSITWVMRFLSISSTIITGIFLYLVYSSDQLRVYKQDVGNDWAAYLIAGAIVVLAIGLSVFVVSQSKAFTNALRVGNFWGTPSLNVDDSKRLIRRFRDEKES